MALQNKRISDGEQPWWVGVVYKVGIPAAIACYLIWFLTVKVDQKIDTTLELVKTHNATMIKQQHEESYYNMEFKRLMESQLKLTQQVCINSAEFSGRNSRDCFK